MNLLVNNSALIFSTMVLGSGTLTDGQNSHIFTKYIHLKKKLHLTALPQKIISTHLNKLQLIHLMI